MRVGSSRGRWTKEPRSGGSGVGASVSTGLTIFLGVALGLALLLVRALDHPRSASQRSLWTQIRRHGFSGVMARLTMWWALLGAVPVWATYSLGDALRPSRYDDPAWGDPVFEAAIAFPAAALLFALATIGAGCLVRVARRSEAAQERTGMLIVAALTLVLALGTLARLLWRHGEGLSPLPYALPVLAAAAVSTWAWLVAFRLPKVRRTT